MHTWCANVQLFHSNNRISEYVRGKIALLLVYQSNNSFYSIQDWISAEKKSRSQIGDSRNEHDDKMKWSQIPNFFLVHCKYFLSNLICFIGTFFVPHNYKWHRNEVYHLPLHGQKIWANRTSPCTEFNQKHRQCFCIDCISHINSALFSNSQQCAQTGRK